MKRVDGAFAKEAIDEGEWLERRRQLARQFGRPDDVPDAPPERAEGR